MRIYSIRYVETMGILEYSGCEIYQPKDSEVRYASKPSVNLFERIGTDCFLTIEEARAGAAVKIRKKIRSTKNKEARLREQLKRYTESLS